MYAIVVAFYATLYKYFDYGIEPYVDTVVYSCKEEWWRNLIYINNFYPDGVPSVRKN